MTTTEAIEAISEAITWMFNNGAQGTPPYERLVELRREMEGEREGSGY